MICDVRTFEIKNNSSIIDGLLSYLDQLRVKHNVLTAKYLCMQMESKNKPLLYMSLYVFKFFSEKFLKIVFKIITVLIFQAALLNFLVVVAFFPFENINQP